MGIFVYKSFLKLLTREGFIPDIIITHRFSYVSIGDRLSELLSIPHIVGVHNSCLQNINLYKDILSRSDSIACRSFSIKRRFLEKLPEFSDKVFIANSGIGKDKILKKADFIKKSDSIKNNKINMISVCGLIPLKNIDIVLRALSDLPDVINWHYTIIGDGPERASLERLTKLLFINDKVSFMGYIENSRVYNFLDESNVFAMVSSPETFGLSYLEAMARGNIVIGTKGWGIDGIVVDGVNGYLCDEVSVVDVRNKIIEIISMTHTERIKMQGDIYMTIKDYTIKEMSQVYFDVIEQCIQEYKENTNHSKVV
jgi:glycosyltransferase involved in cell wall biosynthesis